ncbi:sporulation integral membrane protein YtvI [Metaclostridioides mangenotii]|uniref:sporulation integral membrane protein YtvI n=1 Tax=Metaclostridioides mangenotii TaxID=1540 RepID=UPI00046610C7|nr:sporulation integral membrane protein YtvI [Clostridioides mangenotii]
MPILEKDFIYKLKGNAIFIVIYSLIFLFIYKAFPFIAPFFLGTLIAFMIKPISQKMFNKFKINKGISTLLLSFIAVALVITLTSMGVVNLTKQLMIFINNASNGSYLTDLAADIVNKANILISQANSMANIDIQELTSKFSGNLMSISKSILASTINLATSIPYILMFTVTLFVSTYFIAKDLDKMEASFYNMFTMEVRKKVLNVRNEIGASIFGYIKAYAILMSITAATIFLSFLIFGLPYGFVIGIVGSLMDLIPFLGIISIYLPIIVYHIMIKNYFVAIGMTVVFVLISVVRQILEPKLISANIGLSPLATIAAIFIGIQLKGVIGILFCFGFVCMHNILKKVGIL